MFAIVLLFFLVRDSAGVIYRLNDLDFALMPKLFHLDPYEACYEDPEALYCTVEFALVSDEASPLLTMIQEYSAHTTTHYNHTLLRHGICLTRNCEKFYKVAQEDLRSTLEACLNESIYNKHKLKVKVSDDYDCSKMEKPTRGDIDYVDKAVAAMCIFILCANIIGSICDYLYEKGKYYTGLRYLYCFSIFRNWKKLVASPTADSEPRLQGLKGLHGIRVLTISLVILGHSFMPGMFAIENPEYVENMYITRPYYILLNGTLIMQTFLIISSFLLVYNWLIYAEKQEPSWKSLPKQFLMRWLRLTPSYAVVLALTVTWFGRISSGPYWKAAVYNELSDCRRDWWKNLLYINNYFDGSECMAQTWYLAADTQLYYMAVIIFMMCRTFRAKKVILSLVFIAGIVTPAVHTYWKDLSGVLINHPEGIISMFKKDATFDEVYKRGHTNLTGSVIGMAMGYMIYDWQKTGGDPKSFRKFRYLYWTLFPLGCLCCYSGGIYVADAPRPPLYVNLLYAAFMKPIFGIIVGTVILGIIIQFEGLFRTILEWRFWTTPSRLSYSVYLLHISMIRNYVAMRTTIARTSLGGNLWMAVQILLASFTAAFFFWMLVEAPFGNLVRECLVEPGTAVTQDKNSIEVNKSLKEKEIAETDDKKER